MKDDFATWLDTNRPCLKAYGNHIIQEVDGFLKKNIDPEEYKKIFKILPSYRVKDTKSAVEKIERKNYSDPHKQITDIVGIRFVVLLESEIDIVEKALLMLQSFTFSKDREPLFEISANPESFNYKSLHYVIRNSSDLHIDGCLIKSQTPCEVQIRTLTQHAYAEFVHDRVYKNNNKPSAKMRRLVARAMAMLEATDEIFKEALGDLNSRTADINEFERIFADEYKLIFSEYDKEKNASHSRIFFETYENILCNANIESIKEIFRSNINFIRDNRSDNNLFSQHYVGVVFWILMNHETETIHKWPLACYSNDLESIASKLGISIS